MSPIIANVSSGDVVSSTVHSFARKITFSTTNVVTKKWHPVSGTLIISSILTIFPHFNRTIVSFHFFDHL